MIAATRILLLSVVIAGCSDSGNEQKAIIAFGKDCNTAVSAKLVLSQWNNSLELACSDIGKRIEKEPK